MYESELHLFTHSHIHKIEEDFICGVFVEATSSVVQVGNWLKTF